jgi:chromosome segregation ATPase
MIIKSIEVVGPDVRPASLYFSPGLNVVAGPSNTGKSYLVECLKFVFGATELPKPIKESVGYDTVQLRLGEGNDSFLITRKLVLNAHTTVTNADGTEIVLKGRHKPDLKNLSNYFLNKIGLNNKLLLTNKEKHKTQALTLRTLEKIFIVDEERIVAQYSPLGTGQRTEHTLERSLIKTLLTGDDDSNAKENRDTDENPDAIKRKIRHLEELMLLIFPRAASSASQLEVQTQLASIETAIAGFDSRIRELLHSKSHFLMRRKELLVNAAGLENKIQDAQVMRQRFSLLMDKYQSDRARVVGVSEAAILLENYEEVQCPTCGSHFDDSASEVDVDALLQSAQAEAHKIDVQMQDLQSTINQLNETIRTSDEELSAIKSNIEDIDDTMKTDVGDELAILVSAKDLHFQKKAELTAELAKIEGRATAQIELDKLKAWGPPEKAAYEIPDFSKQLDLFVKNVEDILNRWGFPEYRPTEFEDKARDLKIGGIPRRNFGKGYRAVAFSAFILGLMKTLAPSNRHPGFVVLDSPLTTYKKADAEQGDDDDESIEADMVYSVYRDLCDAYSEQQVIVFDNQEPELDLIPLMSYQHFTKNPRVGRYGFFPLSQ